MIPGEQWQNGNGAHGTQYLEGSLKKNQKMISADPIQPSSTVRQGSCFPIFNDPPSTAQCRWCGWPATFRPDLPIRYRITAGGPEDEMTDGTADLLAPANVVHTKGVLPGFPQLIFGKTFFRP